LLTACGRIGFRSDVATGDAAADALAADARVADARVADAPPADASAAGALVQVQQPGYQYAAMVSASIEQTAGDFLVAAVYWDQNPDNVLLSDMDALLWEGLPSQVIPTGCGGGGSDNGIATGARLYYAQIDTTGSNTVTVVQSSGTQPLGLFLLEYSGIAAGDPIDVQTGQVAGSASNAMAVPPLVTTGRDLVVALFNDTVDMGTGSAGSGYTLEALDPGFPNLIEDAIGPAGTYVPTAVLPPGHNDACWVGTAVAFRTR
jgi:hypothetical protein